LIVWVVWVQVWVRVWVWVFQTLEGSLLGATMFVFRGG